MPPGCPDAADAAGCRPPGNRLRVYSEERSHFPGSEQALIVAIHVPPLLSPFSEHAISVAKTSVYFLVFPKNEPLVLVVSFACDRTRPSGAPRGRVRGTDLADSAREVAGCGGHAARCAWGVAEARRPITECASCNYRDANVWATAAAHRGLPAIPVTGDAVDAGPSRSARFGARAEIRCPQRQSGVDPKPVGPPIPRATSGARPAVQDLVKPGRCPRLSRVSGLPRWRCRASRGAQGTAR
jgi:hypothetical protein